MVSLLHSAAAHINDLLEHTPYWGWTDGFIAAVRDPMQARNLSCTDCFTNDEILEECLSQDNRNQDVDIRLESIS